MKRELRSLTETRAKVNIIKKRDPNLYGFQRNSVYPNAKHKRSLRDKRQEYKTPSAKIKREIKNLLESRARTNIRQKRSPRIYGFKPIFARKDNKNYSNENNNTTYLKSIVDGLRKKYKSFFGTIDRKRKVNPQTAKKSKISKTKKRSRRSKEQLISNRNILQHKFSVHENFPTFKNALQVPERGNNNKVLQGLLQKKRPTKTFLYRMRPNTPLPAQLLDNRRTVETLPLPLPPPLPLPTPKTVPFSTTANNLRIRELQRMLKHLKQQSSDGDSNHTVTTLKMSDAFPEMNAGVSKKMLDDTKKLQRISKLKTKLKQKISQRLPPIPTPQLSPLQATGTWNHQNR